MAVLIFKKKNSVYEVMSVEGLKELAQYNYM